MTQSNIQNGPGVLPWWATGRGFGLFAIVTGAIAWIAAGILVLERLELFKNPDYVTSCDLNPWVSCGTVMKSWQASLFGFPNPLLGIVGFAIVITIGMGLLSGANYGRWFWYGMQVGITAALVFIIWLWSQALYEINALCPYCMVVWAMVIPLFVFTTARNAVHGLFGKSAGLRKFFTEWSWIVTAILWVLVAASVVLRFPNAFFG
ncbi:vitamin K epoxide reductase family protein [Glutamicibacter endophyticus]|uniref:vitamin K epoxide reductase family protein n=1 Tax=Glutamicibacter endophyticus TaxID=1522174 RepID=UPI003AF09357